MDDKLIKGTCRHVRLAYSPVPSYKSLRIDKEPFQFHHSHLDVHENYTYLPLLKVLKVSGVDCQ